MLIIGLGNIGKEYESTRHNMGFMVVDALLDKLCQKAKNKGCKSEYASFFKNGEKIIVAKPTTYMNLSGLAVKELMASFAQKASDLVVVYDDIDLHEGALRLRKSGSSGTHNGMRNIISEINTQDFARIRVGVGRPSNQFTELKDFVLSRPTGEEAVRISQAISSAADALADYIGGESFDAVMQKYNHGA